MIENGAALLQNQSVEIVFLVVAIVIDAFLAIVVFWSNRRSDTNQIFALLTFFTILWLITNFLSHAKGFDADTLTINRLGIFFAAPMSVLFFLLAHTMPSEKILLQPRTLYLVVGSTFLMMALNVSPFAFTTVTVENGVASPVPGPGLLPFSVLSTLFSILAVYWLLRKFFRSRGIERMQHGIVLAGILAMLLLITLTILVPVVLWGSITLLPLTPIYTLAFLGATAYAISKYQLFNIKVLVTQALTLVLLVVLFGKIFGSESDAARVVDILVFATASVFSYFLVKSVRKEVQQRELIEKQEKELELVNQQQESLLHFISHEIKGYLTKSEAAFASIIEGDFGAVTDQLRQMSGTALEDVRKGVRTVMDILDASNLKKGTVNFVKKVFDLKEAVTAVVDQLRPEAENKKLRIDFTVGEGAYELHGDKHKLTKHAIRNLIDNAIKYTPAGTVTVRLEKNDGVYRFSVKDSGVGITAEDMKRLFTEGGHGKDSIKVNVHSTGYGLFIAKQVVEAHGGKIWAQSEGQGKGSTFILELPAK